MCARCSTRRCPSRHSSRFSRTARTIAELLTIFELGTANPTHLFLADVSKAGYVRAIATTNFDSLLEQALVKSGVLRGRDLDVLYRDEDFERRDRPRHPRHRGARQHRRQAQHGHHAEANRGPRPVRRTTQRDRRDLRLRATSPRFRPGLQLLGPLRPVAAHRGAGERTSRGDLHRPPSRSRGAALALGTNGEEPIPAISGSTLGSVRHRRC
jgi:hypothetical protein